LWLRCLFALLAWFSPTAQCLEHCRRAQVLYLYGNRLTSIDCLTSLSNLTHLFLQSNNISRLCGLDGLSKLQKLFLSHNRIRCVEGLATCVSLLELQISDQRMGPDETLTFEESTLHGLSGCLAMLDISKNNVADLSQLRHASSTAPTVIYCNNFPAHSAA
jgi:Leucine-rich repeat (LRR) protein